MNSMKISIARVCPGKAFEIPYPDFFESQYSHTRSELCLIVFKVLKTHPRLNQSYLFYLLFLNTDQHNHWKYDAVAERYETVDFRQLNLYVARYLCRISPMFNLRMCGIVARLLSCLRVALQV